MTVTQFLCLIVSLISQPLDNPHPQCASRDSWGMVVISDWPFGLFRTVPCGDADHDGRREFYACIRHEPYPNYAVEFIDNAHFDTTWLWEYSSVDCVGDLDGDGLVDIVVRRSFSSAQLSVFESPDRYSMPTRLVWTDSIVQAGEFYGTLTDVDIDMAQEMTIHIEGRGTGLYECVGDNRYELKFVTEGGMVPVQTFDMDRDGTPELALGCGGGFVALWEAVGDDTLVLRDTVRIVGTVRNSFFDVIAAAPDMDHDGRTELIAPCLDYDHGLLTLAVLESPCNDSFGVIWAETLTASSESWSVAVGDIEGDSTLEFVLANGRTVRLYRCIGNNRYECFWQVDDGGSSATLYDINSDGRDELIHSVGDYRTFIRAWLPVGVEERVAEALQRVTVAPSIAQRSEVVRIAGLPQHAECEVVDASGRVVATLASGVWRPASSAAGTYFLRIRASTQAVVRKVLVVE